MEKKEQASYSYFTATSNKAILSELIEMLIDEKLLSRKDIHNRLSELSNKYDNSGNEERKNIGACILKFLEAI
jgi:hypothetical protein